MVLNTVWSTWVILISAFLSLFLNLYSFYSPIKTEILKYWFNQNDF